MFSFFRKKKVETPEDLQKLINIKMAELQFVKDQLDFLSLQVKTTMDLHFKYAEDVFKLMYEAKTNSPYWKFKKENPAICEIAISAVLRGLETQIVNQT